MFLTSVHLVILIPVGGELTFTVPTYICRMERFSRNNTARQTVATPCMVLATGYAGHTSRFWHNPVDITQHHFIHTRPFQQDNV